MERSLRKSHKQKATHLLVRLIPSYSMNFLQQNIISNFPYRIARAEIQP